MATSFRVVSQPCCCRARIFFDERRALDHSNTGAYSCTHPHARTHTHTRTKHARPNTDTKPHTRTHAYTQVHVLQSTVNYHHEYMVISRLSQSRDNRSFIHGLMGEGDSWIRCLNACSVFGSRCKSSLVITNEFTSIINTPDVSELPLDKNLL